MSFLNVQIIREYKTFTTPVYCKPTVSGVFTHFESFLTSTYKFGTLYTLAYRELQICSRWAKLHSELVCLKQIFLKNDHPKKFFNKCFKTFMDNKHVVKETTLTVKKKPFFLAFQWLGSKSLQTRTKLKKSLKTSLIIANCK